MEVIYLGLRKSPEKIVETAIEEDIDVIGLSFHSLAHKQRRGVSPTRGSSLAAQS